MSQTTDNLAAHILWAFYHYEEVYEFQFENGMYDKQLWGRRVMNDDLYTPFCEELENMWDNKRNNFLKTI